MLGLNLNIADHLALWEKLEDSRAGWNETGQHWMTFNGHRYQQLFEDIPALEPFYLDFEKNFDPGKYVYMAADNYWVGYAIVAVYLVAIFAGQRIMKSWPAFKLDKQLKMWNLALSLFSTVGMLRTVPQLLVNLHKHGLDDSLCGSAEISYGSGATGLWVCLFVFSKVPELFDTAFIVLRKKPLIFLHWYHHVTVLLNCWDSYASRSAPGLWFLSINYSVHAIMYAYFSGYLPFRKYLAPVITTMQISQMAIGVMVTSRVYYIKFFLEQPCSMTDVSWLGTVLMYSSYLVLFVMFAVHRYCMPRAPRSKSKALGPAPAQGAWTVSASGALAADSAAKAATQASALENDQSAQEMSASDSEGEQSSEGGDSPARPVRRRSRRLSRK